MNKNRYKYYVAIIIAILAIAMNTSINYAIGELGTGNITSQSEELFYIGEKAYPMWTDYKSLENRQYTYVIKDKDKEVLNNLGGFKYRTIENNIQVIQVPYPNGNDPFNLSPLKDERHFYKNFELDGNKVVKTSKASYKVRWETSMGFAYETTYEKSPYIKNSMVGTKNQNYKTQGSDVQTKLPIENGGVRPFIYQNKQGNIRKIIDYTQGGIEAHFIFYNADLVNMIRGWLIDNRNLVKEPWNVYNDIELGKVTDDYLNGKIDDQDAQLIYLNFLKHYSGLRGNLENKGAIKGDPNFDVAARLSQTKKFFEYANIQEKPDKNVSGRAQVGYRGKSSLNYATLVTPAVSSINNIEFYDIQLFDADTGNIIESEKIEDSKFGKIDKFKISSSTESIKVKYRYGYLDSEKRNINVVSLNSQIITNLYFYNNKYEGTFSKQSILGDKTGHLKAYYAFDVKEYLKKAEEHNISDFMTLVSMYPEIELLREEELDTFEVIIPVSELEKSGYIMPNTPWQFDNYNITGEYFGRQIYKDNAFKFDDVGYVKYEVSSTPTRDIKLENLTGLGKWNEELKKYVVTAGKTYTVKVEVVNNGAADTIRVNPNITWEATNMNSMGASQVRANDLHRINPTNPKVLKKDSTDILSYQITVTVPDDSEDGAVFNIGVSIHQNEDNFDNIFIVTDDFIKIETIVSNSLGTADIGIKDIILKSGGTTYNTLVEDGGSMYRLDSNKEVYQAEIIVEKISGLATVTNPQVIFGKKGEYKDAGYDEHSVTFSGTLTNVGDTLSKTVTVSTYSQYLALRARIYNDYHLNTVPKTNEENNNDMKEKTYVSGFDFQVSNVKVSPEILRLSKYENSKSSNVNVTAEISTLSYGTGFFNNVDLRLVMYSPSGSPRLIETKSINLSNGIQSISFSIAPQNYSKGNYAFEIEVNKARRYLESDYTNNKGKDVMSVIKDEPVPCQTYCWGGAPRTSNTWTQRHYVSERKRNIISNGCSRCTSRNSKGGCSNRVYYDCCRSVDSRGYYANPNPKTYTERFTLTAEAKSKKTNWSWNTGSIEVNAGRAYKLQWTVRYSTNRASYPRTEHRLDNGDCGYDRVNPTVSGYYFNTRLYSTISGYTYPIGKCPQMELISSSGDWNSRTLVFGIPIGTDALGDMSRKLYTDLNTSDKTITIRTWTDKINGYPRTYGESTGSNQPLIDCKTTRIYIKDAIDINKKTIK